MPDAAPINREWITDALCKLFESEHALAESSRSRAESPPVPELGVLYHEIAAAEDQHALILETIATRYGHTPSRSNGEGGGGGGIGGVFGRLRQRVSGIGIGPIECLVADLTAKSEAIQMQSAWAHTLEAIGDAESAHDLVGVVAAEQKHRDALQEALNRLIEREARGGARATAAVIDKAAPDAAAPQARGA